MTHIYVVDDNANNLEILNRILQKHGHEVQTALDGYTALQEIPLTRPDLIILDIMMPEMSGIEVCHKLKLDPQLTEIPIIFISARDGTADKVEAFRVGGVDYITKPFEADEVLMRVKTHLMLYQQRREISHLREQDRLYFEKLSQTRMNFVHSVTHDVKSPLSTIMSYASLIKKRVPDDERIQQFATRIQASADVIADLVTNVLDLSRIETGQSIRRAQCNLLELLTVCHQNFVPAAQQKNIAFRLSAVDMLIEGDESLLLRVFTNLVSNAIKYTPEGGTVEIGGFIDPDKAVIRVSDTGLGIPEADLPNVFKTFYRVATDAHLRETGTGLGLAIVKSIVEQHGGQVSVASVLGEGSVFTVELPIHPAEEKKPDPERILRM